MSENIVGSNFPDSAAEQLKPSKANYGQNQYLGAASDLPGENTRSGFLPGPGKPVNSQLRAVSDKPLPTTFGMHKSKAT